jgi:hypothetical protein
MTEFLINHKKNTFNFGNDIGSALEVLSDYNINEHRPKQNFSTNADNDTKAAENTQ